jgi:2-oxoglutarate ferredoxin oxidoreductase subunit gamma
MTVKIICAGFGGQGALVAGILLAHAGIHKDKQVLWLSSYGGEMRGGSANCSLTISDEEIANPYLKEIDILFAMNQVSLEKFENSVKPDGYIVMNSTLKKEDHIYREDIRIIEIDATNIAIQLKNPRGTNMVMLGALARWTQIFKTEELCETIEGYFKQKGKPNAANIECYMKGVELARNVEKRCEDEHK